MELATTERLINLTFYTKNNKFFALRHCNHTIYLTIYGTLSRTTRVGT